MTKLSCWTALIAVMLAACSGSCGNGSTGGDGGQERTAVCGNGILEGSEACDDGNSQAGDCCSTGCEFEAAGSSCSDGLFCSGTESCDGAGGCGSGTGNPCPLGTSCDESLDECVSGSAEGLDKHPVFFVHGSGLSSADWSPLILNLEQEGYPSEFLRTIDLIPNNGPNQAAAENQIAPAIEAFLTDVNAFLNSTGYAGPAKTKVDLISHSMGGLSSRWYAAIVAPERVHTWLSLAGANHGTDDLCPFLRRVPSGADDSCPAYSSDPADTVQLTLNGQPHVADVDETPYGIGQDAPGVNAVSPDAERRILYATVRTEPDNWISPDDSAAIDGAGGVTIDLSTNFPATETSPGNFLMSNGVGHGMTGDSDTMELVKLILVSRP